MKVLPVAHRMEHDGVTLSAGRLHEIATKYALRSEELGTELVRIASGEGYKLDLPKGAINNSLRDFCFDVLRLEHVRNPKAKTDAPSLDAKNAIPYYLATLPLDSVQRRFIETLVEKRGLDTALAYTESYQRFWQPSGNGNPLSGKKMDRDTRVLHPNLNPTGTDTLRWSCNNPNVQQISKQDKANLRYAFGPAPGREWWSLDAKNVELRIPAYESGQEELIALFERPTEPPYFGSNHLLIAHILFPREFEGCLKDGVSFKDRYKSTLYQRIKNGNFAVQYGAIDRADGKGTADRTYGLAGAQALIASRFHKQDALNQKWIRYAERNGFVETLPDRSVDETRGYPILCTRTDYGRILPTVPLNYHVQSTAMWWTMQAMIRIQELLDEWRSHDGFTGFLTMQVHDECVLDFPRGEDPVTNPKRSNLWRIRKIQKAMERCGDDLIPRVPTPVGIEFHSSNWGTGVTL